MCTQLLGSQNDMATIRLMKSKPLKFDNCSTIDCGDFQSPIEIQPNCAIEMQEVGGQAVLGRQGVYTTPWLTERNG
nr:hypothetical protein [Bacillus pacificus]